MTLQKVIHEGNVSEYQSSDCEPLSKTSKSEGTWYQNTSGGALVVMLSISPTSSRPSNTAGIHVNSAESSRKIMQVRAGEDEKSCATFIVPNGHYYKVENEAPDTYDDRLSIDHWTETSLI